MIEISRVVKTFGKRRGLDGFSLTVPAGSLFGLVGPNGAGKSTLMKVLAGLIERDGGTVAIDRADPALQPLIVRAMIGYQPDFAGVYQGMRVHEYLEFFADAFKLGPKKKNAIALALERSRLEERPNDFVEELSFGWKQRLVLAKTLLHEPKVLLLDEPATGLDPIAHRSSPATEITERRWTHCPDFVAHSRRPRRYLYARCLHRERRQRSGCRRTKRRRTASESGRSAGV
jgi:ABC-2 type transport system ATP-binding protein